MWRPRWSKRSLSLKKKASSGAERLFRRSEGSPMQPSLSGESERAAAAAAKPSPRKPAPAAESAATTPSRTGRTRSRRGDQHLMHIARQAVHGTRKENRVEAHSRPVAWTNVPTRRVLHNPRKRLRPMMLHPQRHRIRQIFFKRSRRHLLQTLGIHAIHELLKTQHRDANAPALHGFRRHHPRKQPPDRRRHQDGTNHQRNRIEKVCPSQKLQSDKQNENQNAGANAVSIRRLRIEQVQALVLKRRHDVLANNRHRRVEAILEFRKPRLLPTHKYVLQHHALVRREARIVPLGLRLQ